MADLSSLPFGELVKRATLLRRLAFERARECYDLKETLRLFEVARQRGIEQVNHERAQLMDRAHKAEETLESERHGHGLTSISLLKMEAQRDALIEVVRMNVQAGHKLPIEFVTTDVKHPGN